VISDQVDQEVEGTLQKIVYKDDLSGWSVLHLSLQETNQIITVIGTFVGVQPGERLRIRGKWTNNPEYGRQFDTASYVSLTPKTLSGIQLYLASGLIEGIGNEMSRRLVNAFGLDLLEIIDSQPQRLTQVHGIGKVRAEKIFNAWKRHKEVKDIMIFLQSHGIQGIWEKSRIYFTGQSIPFVL
jgi:exodeoxyribonuclease V alpha subunit